MAERDWPKFVSGQTMGPNGEYEIVDRALKTRGSPRPLGDGGAGTVYRARFRNKLDRAIKFLTPGDPSPLIRDRYTETFARERQILFGITHRNIVKIVDFGEFNDGSKAWPYLVMDYVEGEEFSTVCRSDSIGGEEVLRLVEDIIDGLEFLHTREPPILHADIKSANVLGARTGDRFESVILDLGAAHVVTPLEIGEQPEFLGLDETDSTLFVSTIEIAHSSHQKYVGKKLPRNLLRSLFPFYDFYALGLMLRTVLGQDVVRNKLRADLGADRMSALEMLIENLLSHPDSPHYTDIRRIREDWRKLSATYLAPIGIPELSIAAQFRHSLLGPNGRTTITDRLHPILNHKLFQRLRDVPQLEYVALKYPGATHSRFQHATSVYRNTRYYLAHLLNHPTFRLMASKADIEATLLLALLHDIGHYQLSHMFEDYATDDRDAGAGQSAIVGDDDLFLSVLDPDGKTLELISSEVAPNATSNRPYGVEIDEAWSMSCDSLKTEKDVSIAKLILDNYGRSTLLSLVRIRGAVMQSHPCDQIHNILAGVLSSPIDSDKISYLVDDAWESGVSYGKGIDLDGILGALRPPEPSDIRGPTIAISDKGIAAVESVTMARQWMIRQIYWHHTNRAVMAMCKYVISRLRSEDSWDFGTFLKANFFASLHQTTHSLSQSFDAIMEADEVNPLHGLLEGERGLYKRVYTKTEGPSGRDTELYEQMSRRSYAEIASIEERLRRSLNQRFRVQGKRDALKGEVLLDVPKKNRGTSGGEHGARLIVYSRNRGVPAQEIEVSTPLFQNLVRENMAQANKIRVFVAPSVFNVTGIDELSDFFNEEIERIP